MKRRCSTSKKCPRSVTRQCWSRLYEFVRRGVTDELCRRFAPSHAIERVWQEPRSRAEFPWRTLSTRLLPVSYLDWAVSEWRPEPMSWLWMTPKAIDG